MTLTRFPRTIQTSECVCKLPFFSLIFLSVKRVLCSFVFGTSSCVKPDFPWAPTQFWAWSWLLRLTGLGDQTGGFATRNRVQGFDKLATNTVIGREWPALRFFLQLG